ncbi:hypothetical protein BGZ80_003825, partial [Entomortierella chlamydospora]
TFNGQHTFRHKRKREFLRLDQDEQDEFDHLALDLTGNNQDVKKALKAFVENQLSVPEDNKFGIDESFGDYQADYPRLNRRYLLTGAMVTNGYELKLLAYSLTKTKDSFASGPKHDSVQVKEYLDRTK